MTVAGTILVFDSEEASRRRMVEALEADRYEVLATGSEPEAIELCAELDFDVGVVEVTGDSLAWVEIRARLKGKSRFVPVILLARDPSMVAQTSHLRASDGLLKKPIDLDELKANVHAQYRAKLSFDRLVGSDRGALLADVNGLTGTFNRQFLSQRLTEELRRARTLKQPLAVVVIDLDDFRDVNDRFGFNIGDEILKQVADLLRTTVRSIDTVCRYGGQEFVAILPHSDGIGATIAADRLRRAIEASTFETTGGTSLGPIRITASVGVAGCDAGAADPSELLATAAEAAAIAKQDGKNRVVLGGR